MSLAVPDKAGDVLQLALRSLDALQELQEARTMVRALGASGTKQSARIDA